MIEIISGKPGGGKSLLATRRIIQELKTGRRIVATNVPLVLPNCAAFLDRELPSFKFLHLTDKIHLLDEKKVKEFYLDRPGWEVKSERDAKGRVKNVSWEAKFSNDGILYVIDEAHCFFNAHDWQEGGEGIRSYISQHRHLGDDVVFVTQHPDKLSKQLRLDAEVITFIRNLGTSRLGPFRLWANKFALTAHENFGGTISTTGRFEGVMKLDVAGLASCYSTVAGVGISGGATHGADMGRKFKGIPIVWLVVVLIGLGWMLTKVPDWFSKGLNYMTGGPVTPVKMVASPVPTAVGSTPAAPVGVNAGRVREAASNPVPAVAEKPKVFAVGFSSIDMPRLWLSDGRELTGGEFRYAGRKFIVDGETVEWAKGAHGPSASAMLATGAPTIVGASSVRPSEVKIIRGPSLPQSGARPIGKR